MVSKVTYAGAVDLGVVGRVHGGGEVQQGRSGVRNADDRAVDKIIVADLVAGAGELPVAGQLGHGDIGQVAIVSGVINEAKVVSTSCGGELAAIKVWK